MSTIGGGRTRAGWPWLITTLILLLAGVAVFLVSRPSRPDGALGQTRAPQSSAPQSSAPQSSAPQSSVTRPAESSATTVPTLPTGSSGGAVAADAPGPDSNPGLTVPGWAAAGTPVPSAGPVGSCGHWRASLSDEQRTSYAVASLRSAWQIDGSAGIPPASAVRAYRSAISTACAGKDRANDNVVDVARVVYAAGRHGWGP